VEQYFRSSMPLRGIVINLIRHRNLLLIVTINVSTVLLLGFCSFFQFLYTIHIPSGLEIREDGSRDPSR
jgi:hypothetical protein